MEEIVPINTSQLVRVNADLAPCTACRNWVLPYQACPSCGAPAARRASLSELLRSSGRKGISPQVVGDIEITHRNKDTGALVRRVAYHNIPTWFLQSFWAGENRLLNHYICISNDNVDMHPRKNVTRTTYEGGIGLVAISASATIDYAAQTYTYNASFGAPTTESRFVHFVGLCTAAAVANGTYRIGTHCIIAGKTLTTVEEQTTGNLVEVIYRLTFKKG